MQALLAPVLAQVITLGLADRLEARYVASAAETQANGTHIPAVRQFDGINTTTPSGLVKFDLRRASISVGYAPTLTLVPLIETPREFLVYHRALLSADYRFKHTTVALGTTAGYGERDFALEALMPRTTAGTTPQPNQPTPNNNPQNPNAPNGTPQPAGGTTAGTTGTQGGSTPANTGPTTFRPVSTKASFADFRTFLTITHSVSRPLTLRLQGGYGISGGTTDADRRNYPLATGPDATLAARYTADPRNAFVTTLTAVYTRKTPDPEIPNSGTRTYYTTLTEDYVHGFTRQTLGIFGAGLSFSRQRGDADLAALYSIYPVARAGVSHSARVAQGMLMVTADVNTQPLLDLNTARVDPRIGTNLAVMWNRDRFSLIANAASTITVQREGVRAFSSVLTSATARYDLGAGFGVDVGGRTAFQRYYGQDTIPQTWVLFLGVTYNFLQPFNESRPRKAAAAGGGGAAPGDTDKGGAPGGAAGAAKGGTATGGSAKGGGAAPAGGAP